MNKRSREDLFRHFDAGVIVGGLNQLWRLLAGPLIQIYCIPVFLSPADQGVWFAMISLSALTVFADLGFTNIIMQFAAHEFSGLGLDDRLRLIGPDEAKRRLGSLFRFATRWIAIATMVLTPLILLAGAWFLPGGERREIWLLPWILYVLGSAIALVLNIVLSFLEGCGQVARVQGIKTFGAMLSSMTMFGLLISRRGLLALAAASVASNGLMAILAYSKYRGLLGQLRIAGRAERLGSWASSVLRLLWRYAVSWASGYFILQLYVPIMLKVKGEVAAGRIGLSWSIISAAFSLSNVWIYTATPALNRHIARREWSQLDRLAITRLTLSLATFVTGCGVFIVFLAMFGGSLGIGARFLSPIGMGLLALGWCLQMVVNLIATYLRGFKEEPFMLPSIVGGAWILASSLLAARYLSVDMYFVGFLSSFIIGLPWAWTLLSRKRKTLEA